MTSPLLLSLVLVSTSTATSGSSLFSDEEIPDQPSSESSGGLSIIEDDLEPAPSSFVPRVRGSVLLGTELALDTSFDRPNEQIFELAFSGKLELDADLLESVSVFVAPQFRHVSAWNRDGEDRQFLFLLFPEAYATWVNGPFHLRAGTIIFSWGASDLVGPSDVLNPYDFRRPSLSAPGDAKIPVLAAEGVLRLDFVTLRAVVEPLFTASRFFLVGWDSGVFQLSGRPLLENEFLPPTTIDLVGDELVILDRPAARPDNATLAARITMSILDDVDLSFTAVHGWDTFPRLRIDDDIIFLGTRVLEGVTMGQAIELTDPEILGAVTRIQDAVEEGRTLYEGNYRRKNLVGFDIVWPLDPFILKADVAYTFDRTFYTQDLRPVNHPWLNAVVGMEYVHGEEFQVLVEAFALTVFDVRSHYRIILIEPLSPPPSQFDVGERTVTMPGTIGVVRYAVLDGDLGFELGVLTTFHRGDLALIPSVLYRLDDHHHVELGAMVLEGKDDGYAGIYTNNDQIILGYTYSP